jgi:hypothetical protein
MSTSVKIIGATFARQATTDREKRFSGSIIVFLVFLIGLALVTSGSIATSVYSTTPIIKPQQTLPNCIDPTGHNLPCVLFISTQPPPNHTISCQETSGQVFKCTFIIEKLPNGSKIVTITVYIPTNTVVKQIQSIHVVRVNVRVSVHSTFGCEKDRHIVIIDGLHECVPNNPTPHPDDSCLFNPEQDKCKPDPKTGQCPPGFNMNGYEHCFPNKQCPKGFENHDNDETGTCYPVTTSTTHNNVSNTTNSNPGPSSKSSTHNGTRTTTTPLSSCDPTIKNCTKTGMPSLPGPPLSNNQPSPSQEQSSNPTPPD